MSVYSLLCSFSIHTRNSELVFWIPWSFRQNTLTNSQTTGSLKIALVPAQLHIGGLEIWARKYLQSLQKTEARSKASLLVHDFISTANPMKRRAAKTRFELGLLLEANSYMDSPVSATCLPLLQPSPGKRGRLKSGRHSLELCIRLCMFTKHAGLSFQDLYSSDLRNGLNSSWRRNSGLSLASHG